MYNIVLTYCGAKTVEPQESKEYGKYCDRCGCLLTKENNKCGFDICDKCNDWLEELVNKQEDLVKD